MAKRKAEGEGGFVEGQVYHLTGQLYRWIYRRAEYCVGVLRIESAVDEAFAPAAAAAAVEAASSDVIYLNVTGLNYVTFSAHLTTTEQARYEQQGVSFTLHGRLVRRPKWGRQLDVFLHHEAGHAATPVLDELQAQGEAAAMMQPQQSTASSNILDSALANPGGGGGSGLALRETIRAQRAVNPGELLRFLRNHWTGLGEREGTRLISSLGVDNLLALLTHSSQSADDPLARLFHANVERLGLQLPDGMLARLQSAYTEGRAKIEALGLLASVGITGVFPTRIWDAYGISTLEVLRANPYRLIKDVPGIGFKRADMIARKLGLEILSPDRLRAGVLHALGEQCEQEGHLWLERALIEAAAAQLLETARTYVRGVFDQLVASGELVIELQREGEGGALSEADEIERVYLPGFHVTEIRVARNLAALTRGCVEALTE